MNRRTFRQTAISGLTLLIVPVHTEVAAFAQGETGKSTEILPSINCEQWLLQTRPERFATITDVFTNPKILLKHK